MPSAHTTTPLIYSVQPYGEVGSTDWGLNILSNRDKVVGPNFPLPYERRRVRSEIVDGHYVLIRATLQHREPWEKDVQDRETAFIHFGVVDGDKPQEADRRLREHANSIMEDLAKSARTSFKIQFEGLEETCEVSVVPA